VFQERDPIDGRARSRVQHPGILLPGGKRPQARIRLKREINPATPIPSGVPRCACQVLLAAVTRR
jgi:hypothetical protein